MRRRLPTVLLAALTALPVVLVAAPADAAIATSPGQSTYVPMTPKRVLDTRNGTGGHSGKVGSQSFIDLNTGLPSNATAVVLNVTSAGSTADTVVTVYPTNTSSRAVPTVSNLNVAKGKAVADLVTVVVGNDEDVRLFNQSGATDLIADLEGYYVSGNSGTGFTPTAPVRLLDTRTAGVPLIGGQPRALDVSKDNSGNPSGVPSNATAVAITMTGIAPNTDTVYRAYPTGGAIPGVSNLNPAKGAVIANLAIVQLGSGTSISLLNGAGQMHTAIDLVGWYTPGAGDVFHPVSPYRALDTRTTTPVAQGSPRSLTLAGTGTVPWSASAVALTLTAVKPDTNTYLTLYPAVHGSTTAPHTSTLDAPAGATVPSAAMVQTGDEGQVRVLNYARGSNVLADVAGWFGPAGEGYDISWPQCSPDRTSTTSEHPSSAAFAVIGLTNGKPYTDNACLRDEFAWANGLPGGGAGYIILNSPGPGDANWGTHRSPMSCDGTDSTGCAYDYGYWASDHALQTLPATSTGGRPQVWLDVEGPYSSGPVWDSSQKVNSATIQGARDRLRAAGVRTGIYSRQRTQSSSTGTRTDDWFKLTGGLTLPNAQQWVFTSTNATTAAALCVPGKAFTSGPVILSQYQTQVDDTTYDTNHAC